MAKKKGRYWPALLVVLALIVLTPNFVLVYMATSDPSFAVEEDYYQKALDWDARKAQERDNAHLGWELTLEPGTRLRPDGSLPIHIELRDARGLGVEGAQVSLEAFANARAANILEARLSGGDRGFYSTNLRITRPGLWEFRFEVQRGADRFTHTTVRELGWQR